MPFSIRKRAATNHESQVFVYDQIPEGFRNQVIHIWRMAIGEQFPLNESGTRSPKTIYDQLERLIAEMHGKLTLKPNHLYPSYNALIDHFLVVSAFEALDIVEVSFRSILTLSQLPPVQQQAWKQVYEITIDAVEAVERLNHRFREHRLGYEFVANGFGEIVEKANELLHQEVVVPALVLIRDEQFDGADAEYLKAHEYYRHGDNDACINECNKALESTMKTICVKRGWSYNDKHDGAKKLLAVCKDHGLFPLSLESHFSALVNLIEGGVPTIRNSMSGHGDGEHPIDAPHHYAAFLLHETASTIIFLIECYKALSLAVK